MNRTEIEVKLNRDRAWLLETYAAMPADEVTRAVTASEHDPSVMWSAKDHLAHLAGIEREFNRMIERHLARETNPVALVAGADGKPRPLPEIMKQVDEMNQRWVDEHASKSLSDVVALGQRLRSETLALLARLTDGQLGQKLPGAPWADGTIGGVIGVNADHGRQHYGWWKEGMAAATAG